MNYPPKKLPEIRKDSFKNAREALGLSVKDLSQKACFSIRQIEQIESGESNAFYSAQVKYTAAKKVAGLLGLSEEDAFVIGGMDSIKKTESDSVKPAEVVQQNNELSVIPTRTVEKLESSEMHAVAPKQNKIGLDASSATSVKSSSSQKKIILTLGILAALAFAAVNLRPLFFPEPVKEEIVVVEEVAPPVVDVNTDQKTAPAPTPNSDPPVATVPAAVVATVSTECPVADNNVATYKPEAPKKAGDMVYLQSKTAQTVCVVDATGKTQNKMLEPGMGVSIFGKPPFKVLTPGQAVVDMFYQGAKVRLSNTTAKTILLEPAEVAQPVTSVDSQLR